MPASLSTSTHSTPQPARRTPGEFLLLLTAILGGSGFIAQRQGMLYFKPFTFVAIRFLVGGCIVLAFILLRNQRAVKSEIAASTASCRYLLLGALACGIALCGGTSLQQIGLVTTNASKAGFITTLYMVFVPVISFIIGRKIQPKIWVAVLLAVLGLYFLSIKSGFSIEKGDLTVLLGSIVWACHILLLDHFSARVDSLKLACGQFFVTALIASLIAIFIEGPQAPAFSLAWWTVLYDATAVVGIAFTLQVIAQQTVKPSIGALILSLEAVFALFFGVLLLQERPTVRELLGCALVGAAVLLVQLRLPTKDSSPSQKKSG